MIPASRLWRIVARNSMRSRSQFALSAFGIVVGIASYVFFLGLAMGVRDVVLAVFPVDRVEVVAPRTSFIGADTTKKLDDGVVEALRANDMVKSAVPRMAIAFPALGYGTVKGNKLRLELVGDGIDASFMAGEDFADKFKYWEAEQDEASLPSCAPPKYKCEGINYCDRRALVCRHRVPMIVSPNLLEIYNKQFASTHGMPVIGGLESFALKNLRVHVMLGGTMFGATTRKLETEPYKVEGVLLGVSDKAIPIGVTIPIDYVRKWNREFIGEAAAATYSSVVVQLESPDQTAEFGAWIIEELDLRLEDSQGERFAMVIVIVTLLFLLISLVIVTISAINIAHNFFMQVSDRRREIGIMRAIGATQTDVRRIILGEAGLIGVVAGIIGCAVAVGASFLANALAARYLPDFPFKPETFFDIQWWILASGLAFSMVFCVLGGFWPARRAARMPPAQALAQR